MQKVLIIEDEQELAEILGEYLKTEGYEVTLAFDGKDGLDKALSGAPDLILLDIMLPEIDGITICKRVREVSDAVIIMLSAKSGEMDKVVCLGSGADDYVTKPFSPLELVARVKANLRRFGKSGDNAKKFDSNALSAGELTLNKKSYTAKLGEKNLELTTKEFDLLYLFAENPGRVFTKEQIYDSIWGATEYGDISAVAVYINRIRAKLSEHGVSYIKTVWGVGYKFAAE